MVVETKGVDYQVVHLNIDLNSPTRVDSGKSSTSSMKIISRPTRWFSPNLTRMNNCQNVEGKNTVLHIGFAGGMLNLWFKTSVEDKIQQIISPP